MLETFADDEPEKTGEKGREGKKEGSLCFVLTLHVTGAGFFCRRRKRRWAEKQAG